MEVAQWMLGSRVTAKCLTDEAYRRWYGLSGGERSRIRTPRTWLSYVVGRPALARPAAPGPPAGIGEALLGSVETWSPARR
ncbi:hypothetical protein [Streptomyces sp. NPDC002265]|uniref:hypothetical protein n=1 Tax=Streptomyces sp. NPDC002265 TaxID=3154415 RepID=UPI00331B03C6